MLKQLTTRKVSEFGVFSGMYFPVFGLNMVINIVHLRIQYKYEKTGTRKNFISGLFARSGCCEIIQSNETKKTSKFD